MYAMYMIITINRRKQVVNYGYVTCTNKFNKRDATLVKINSLITDKYKIDIN